MKLNEAYVDRYGMARDDDGTEWFVGKGYSPGTYSLRDLPAKPGKKGAYVKRVRSSSGEYKESSMSLSSKLRSLVADAAAPSVIVPLEGDDAKLYSMLRTDSERATKGRLISRWSSMTENVDGLVLKATFEGPHAKSVATQVGHRFEAMDGVQVSVEKKGKAAVLCVRPPKEKP